MAGKQFCGRLLGLLNTAAFFGACMFSLYKCEMKSHLHVPCVDIARFLVAHSGVYGTLISGQLVLHVEVQHIFDQFLIVGGQPHQMLPPCPLAAT